MSMKNVTDLIVNDLTYMPSHEQRKLKSAFWLRFNDNPVAEPGNITLAMVDRIAPDSRTSKWWSQPGFRAWFLNHEEFRERVESMAHLALDTLMTILVTDDPKMSSARVNAAKLLLEIGRKLPSRTAPVEKFVDARIGEMTKAQLDVYISSRTAPIRIAAAAAEELVDSLPKV